MRKRNYVNKEEAIENLVDKSEVNSKYIYQLDCYILKNNSFVMIDKDFKTKTLVP